MFKFKVGDIVKNIKKGSRHEGNYARVIELISGGSAFPYLVEYVDGVKGRYRGSDLKYVLVDSDVEFNQSFYGCLYKITHRKNIEESFKKLADERLKEKVAGTHYDSGDVRNIDYIHSKLTKEEFRGFCKGNILKYVVRAGVKSDDSLEDFRKAKDYLQWAIENETGEDLSLAKR